VDTHGIFLFSYQSRGCLLPGNQMRRIILMEVDTRPKMAAPRRSQKAHQEESRLATSAKASSLARWHRESSSWQATSSFWRRNFSAVQS